MDQNFYCFTTFLGTEKIELNWTQVAKRQHDKETQEFSEIMKISMILCQILNGEETLSARQSVGVIISKRFQLQ